MAAAGLADRHQRQPHRLAGAVGNDDVFRAIDTMQFYHALGDLPTQLLIAKQFVGIETTLAESPRHLAGGLLQRMGRQEIGMRHRRAQVDQVRIFGSAQDLPGQRLAGDFGGRDRRIGDFRFDDRLPPKTADIVAGAQARLDAPAILQRAIGFQRRGDADIQLLA